MPPTTQPRASRDQYTISEAADALGVAAGTLRRWEEEGRLEPRRTFGGHRRYSHDQIAALLEESTTTENGTPS